MILRGVLRQGLLMALSGAIVGVVGALAASYVPAWRASRTDPVTTLKSE